MSRAWPFMNEPKECSLYQSNTFFLTRLHHSLFFHYRLDRGQKTECAAFHGISSHCPAMECIDPVSGFFYKRLFFPPTYLCNRQSWINSKLMKVINADSPNVTNGKMGWWRVSCFFLLLARNKRLVLKTWEMINWVTVRQQEQILQSRQLALDVYWLAGGGIEPFYSGLGWRGGAN